MVLMHWRNGDDPNVRGEGQGGPISPLRPAKPQRGPATARRRKTPRTAECLEDRRLLSGLGSLLAPLLNSPAPAASVPAVITAAVVLPLITPTASAQQSPLPEPTAEHVDATTLSLAGASPATAAVLPSLSLGLPVAGILATATGTLLDSTDGALASAGSGSIATALTGAQPTSSSAVPGLLSVGLDVQVNLGIGGTGASLNVNVGGAPSPTTAGTSSAGPLELGAALDLLGLSVVVQTPADPGGGGSTTGVPSAPASGGGVTVAIAVGGGAGTTPGQGVSVGLTLGTGGSTGNGDAASNPTGPLSGPSGGGSGMPSPVSGGGAVAPQSANAADGGRGAPAALGTVETGAETETDGPAGAELAASNVGPATGVVIGVPTTASAATAKAWFSGDTTVEAAGARAEVVPQLENVELPAATSSEAQDLALAGPAGASADVPGSLLAELWSGDVEALERSLRQFMERVDDLGDDLSAWVSQASLLDLLLAAGATAAAAELIRRRLRRSAIHAQQTGERRWSPALPGPLYQLGV